jgi:radical SAM protein with 4Fe4S-binding SPASM domain
MESGLVAQAEQVPKAFIFELTRRCNNSCGYCYNVWRAPQFNYERDCPRELSTAEVKEIVARLQDEVGATSIGLSGGEPMLRDDVPELLQFIRSRDMETLLLTNGTLLTEDRVAATMVGGRYEVPLLSYRREVHDRLVGRAGAWDAVIEGIMNVHLAGGRLSVVFVATRQNWQDLRATATLAMMLGADELLYNRINIGAANLKLAAELFLTPAMVEENLQSLETIAVEDGFPVSVAVVLEPCVVDLGRFPHVERSWCPLAGEGSAFIIDPSGNVRICKHSPKILGNITRSSFLELYRHPYVESFRTTWPLECKTCASPLKEQCRGGCKAAAAQACGSFEHVDPFVTLHR